MASARTVQQPKAEIVPFPLERRAVPRTPGGAVTRARRLGLAADFPKAERERETARAQEKAAALGVVRSPAQLLMLAMLRSLAYSQRDEVRKALEATREAFPDDPSAEGALLLMGRL